MRPRGAREGSGPKTVMQVRGLWLPRRANAEITSQIGAMRRSVDESPGLQVTDLSLQRRELAAGFDHQLADILDPVDARAPQRFTDVGLADRHELAPGIVQRAPVDQAHGTPFEEMRHHGRPRRRLGQQPVHHDDHRAGRRSCSKAARCPSAPG